MDAKSHGKAKRPLDRDYLRGRFFPTFNFQPSPSLSKPANHTQTIPYSHNVALIFPRVISSVLVVSLYLYVTLVPSLPSPLAYFGDSIASGASISSRLILLSPSSLILQREASSNRSPQISQILYISLLCDLDPVRGHRSTASEFLPSLQRLTSSRSPSAHNSKVSSHLRRLRVPPKKFSSNSTLSTEQHDFGHGKQNDERHLRVANPIRLAGPAIAVSRASYTPSRTTVWRRRS